MKLTNQEKNKLKKFIGLRDIIDLEISPSEIFGNEKYASLPEIKEIKNGYSNPLTVSSIIVIRSSYLTSI